MNFSVSHIHTLQNSPSTPPYADFRACQEARAKLPRGSYEGQGPKQTSEGGPGQGTSKQASKITVPQKGGKGKGKASTCTSRGPRAGPGTICKMTKQNSSYYETMHAEKMWRINSLLRSWVNCGYHAAVGELLVWNREPKSAVGMPGTE